MHFRNGSSDNDILLLVKGLRHQDDLRHSRDTGLRLSAIVLLLGSKADMLQEYTWIAKNNLHI